MGRSKKTNNENEVSFGWTDDEIELLLSVIISFKAEKESEGYDWESVKTKYESITERFVKNNPKTISDKFPKTNVEAEFTKARVLAKVKAIRLKYRKAVDSGRRSGGGRVVATFFESCENIWGGSPAAEMIEGGLESSDRSENHLETQQATLVETQREAQVLENRDSQDEEDENSVSVGGVSSEPQISNPNKRRNLVDHITNQRNAKLMKKLSVEKVMLDIAKEDVALKKEFFAEMKNSDKEQCDQLRALNETMLNLTKSINEGVRLFGQPTPPAIMQNRQFVPPYPTHSMMEQTSHVPSMIDQTTHVHGQNVGVVHPINGMNPHGNTYNFH